MNVVVVVTGDVFGVFEAGDRDALDVAGDFVGVGAFGEDDAAGATSAAVDTAAASAANTAFWSLFSWSVSKCRDVPDKPAAFAPLDECRCSRILAGVMGMLATADGAVE